MLRSENSSTLARIEVEFDCKLDFSSGDLRRFIAQQIDGIRLYSNGSSLPEEGFLYGLLAAR